MKTKLIRVYETDYETIKSFRRALVKRDGINWPTASVMSQVLKQALPPADQVQSPAESHQE